MKIIFTFSLSSKNGNSNLSPITCEGGYTKEFPHLFQQLFLPDVHSSPTCSRKKIIHGDFLNKEHKITSGFFVENTVIVAEGELLSNGTFQVCNSYFLEIFNSFLYYYLLNAIVFIKSCTG
jgi:hypothetical protein